MIASAQSAAGIVLWFSALAWPIVALTLGVRIAQQRKATWLIHLALAPLLLVSEWALVWLFGLAIGDDGEGPPGQGFVYLPMFLITFGTLLMYYFRLIVILASWVWKRLLPLA